MNLITCTGCNATASLRTIYLLPKASSVSNFKSLQSIARAGYVGGLQVSVNSRMLQMNHNSYVSEQIVRGPYRIAEGPNQ
jgi:hypothetical protein